MGMTMTQKILAAHAIDYKKEILKGNFQIDFYGSLWVIIK
jgi:hypothetical protein